MYYNDHPPPHFHARYAEHHVQIEIATGTVLHGSLPRRALALLQEWTIGHREELVRNWRLAEQEEPLATIGPLP